MRATQLAVVLIRGLYVSLPLITAFLVTQTDRSIDSLIFDVAISSVPLVLLAIISWRLVWPRWKLFGKLLIHPCIYLILSLYIHHWTILLAWLHQGSGLVGHIWFCRRHGFTWYAVEDPERYIEVQKQWIGYADPPTSSS